MKKDLAEIDLQQLVAPVGARCLGVLESANAAQEVSGQGIRDALHHPLWSGERSGPVFDRIRPGEKTCLVVSDHTRKTATDLVLPAFFEGLKGKGCRLEDFFFLFATGIHRHPRTDEVDRILGAAVSRAFAGRIFMHDPDDDANLVQVGVTPGRHPVRLNRRAVEAQRLVLIGAATYHYHAGFGGGRKSLVPGLASRTTIAYNHSLTLDPAQDRIHPGVRIGVLDGNPVASEMFEGAALRSPDFIVNTVLTPEGRLAGVFAGDMDPAHRAACRRVEDVSRVDIREAADLVIASAGTASNWIQSHKALFNASRAVSDSGLVVLVAPCPDGIGDERFRHWVKQPDLASIYRGLRESPEVLGQTALSTRLRGARTLLVTRMAPAEAADLGIETAPDLESAVSRALERLRTRVAEPTCYLMPRALYTVPFTVSP